MKKIVPKNITKILLILLIIFLVIPTYSSAVSSQIDPDDWEPNDLNASEVSELTDAASTLVGAIRTIGIVVTVVAIMILGIKYMVGSVGERAEYKKTMKPFIIGVVLFFTLSQVLAIIIDVANSIG